MSKHRRPPPAFKTRRERIWDIVKWILVLLAALLVYKFWSEYSMP